MKIATAILAAGLLSASVAAHAQQIVQPGAPLPAAQQDLLSKLQLGEQSALQAILTSPQLAQQPQLAQLVAMQQQQAQIAPPTPQQAQARQQLQVLLQQAAARRLTPQEAQAALQLLQQGQGAKTQIGGIALPQMPANLLDPNAATQATSDIYSFMALFQKMAQQMRDTARNERNAQMEAQVQSLQDAAEKMKQAAAANFQAAQVNGAMQIASGITQIGATGIAGMGAAGKGQAKPQGQLESKAGAMGGAGSLAGQGKPLSPQEKQQAMGSIVNAQQAFAANMAAAEADKKKAEAQAQAASAQTSQQSQQMMQQMQDVIRDIQQKLQAIQQSQVETAKAITRN